MTYAERKQKFEEANPGKSFSQHRAPKVKKHYIKLTYDQRARMEQQLARNERPTPNSIGHSTATQEQVDNEVRKFLAKYAE